MYLRIEAETAKEAAAMNTIRSHRTILDALCARASAQPGRSAYFLLSDEGAEAGSLTWGDLARRIRSLGRRFAAMQARGERAVLLYPTGLDYITSLYACLYAGVIAVPAYPPRINRHLSRILGIVEDCAPRYVLTDSSVMAGVKDVLANHPQLQKLEWIVTDTLDATESADWRPAPSANDAPAFLQYTSGSTSAPKGVIVTHENLTRNLTLIGEGFGVDQESTIVSWLPMYHDMGLIGNILATGWLGSECYVMSPAAFVRRPAAWLQAISRFGATASGGPNFAYDLCAEKISAEECAGLDLSRWRTAFNGAEPLRAATMERFAEKFAPYGFTRRAFFPCYGLAEATLFVAGSRPGTGTVEQEFDKREIVNHQAVSRKDHGAAQTYVSSGQAHVDRVTVVDPSSRRECPAGTVGEIWVSDRSVARGYWGKSEVSSEVFGARLASTGEGPFLRTGDLGTIRDGELFVLGRLKDLIIVRGRNVYPQDIEATAELSSPALCPRGVVAFGVEQAGEERLVIVAEVLREQRSRLKADEEGEAVYRAIASEHGVSLFELVFVRPATTLKTSSGKLQRNATRAAYLDGKLDVLAVWRNVVHDEEVVAAEYAEDPAGSLSDLEGWLASAISAKLNVPASKLDSHRPIAEYGLDSLTGVELIAAIEQKLGMELPFELLFIGEPSLSALAAMLSERLRARGPSDHPGTRTCEVPIPLPLHGSLAPQEVAL
jgi:acyl-CoA synthetase (AMP-forming)/AMP-acid ligase II/acyl carrier protein